VEIEEFKEFVEEKANETKQARDINWRAQKQEWLRHLREFYSIIAAYLAEFVKTDKIKIESSPVFLTEEHIGTYEAESKIIVLGLHKVRLIPIGTFLIGAQGRVDMVGPAGTVKFILTGKHSNGIRISLTIQGAAKRSKAVKNKGAEAPEEFVWKIATPPPRVRFIELTREAFFNALTEVLNG
jgi:tRNA pseudouridine-54 N-methylase